MLQAGVTQPWSDARYVPAVFRDAYATAFQQFGWAGDAAAMVVFGLMVKFRENFFQDDDKIRALAGSRLDEARRDPAFASIVSTILREHSGNARGEINDARSIFFSRSAYCRWDDVRVPTLVVHDSEDTSCPSCTRKRRLGACQSDDVGPQPGLVGSPRGTLRCVERCCPSAAQARRSDTCSSR